MKHKNRNLIIILIIIAVSVLLAFFGLGSKFKSAREMRFGIDIRGGVEAVFKPEGLTRNPTESELEAARNVMETRLDAKNISDREITVDKQSGYIIVRFPWKSDEANFNPESAIKELGEMAILSFKDSSGKTLVDGKNVKKSSVVRDQDTGEYQVQLVFDGTGTKKFADATAKLVGQPMGIYMDETLISNPTVKSEITGGKAYIDGMSGVDEATDLSQKINAGSLPFSLKTTSFSTISPSLGNGALKVMVVSGIIAFFLVCIFMISYYKLPGFVACLTLTLQMALQLLAISVPQFTLTLPGIAGIILTLGMSVDANVIISERISEEIKKGMSVQSAIKTGYKNAWSAVLDGNVTTAIVAVILMIFGSGSMVSFGYTLVIGMIINLIVAVNESKTLLLAITGFHKFNDAKWFRKKKDRKSIRFFESRKKYYALSLSLFAIGLIFCFTKGVKLDTQFTGGAVLTYTLEGTADQSACEQAINSAVNRPATIQVSTANGLAEQKLVVTLAGNEGLTPDEQQKITDSVNAISDQFEVKLAETYVVAPYVGAKALKNAAIAIILSSLFIIVYVWIRFTALSGLAAGVTSMVALIHDCLMVFFAFVVFGIPLNDAFVSVVLTIIGYSINDTIVVYDRIRENRQKEGKKDVVGLVNKSITQTMVRSINSSVTTATCVLIILISSIMYDITSIRVFALPMLIGVISGVYSTVCVAGVIWASWELRKENKVKKLKASKAKA